ncbi:MAG: DEAD/DEAH box helicase, partial [Lentisphaeria bacterium]
MTTTNQSWLTSDEQERGVRRNRALTEAMKVTNKSPGEPVFSVFTVATADEADVPQMYDVEIRSLIDDVNTCACPDFDKNGLGTCKHIEKVLLDLRRTKAGRAALKDGGVSPRLEVYVQQPERQPIVVMPDSAGEAVRSWITRFIDARHQLRSPWEATLPVFLREFRNADPDIIAQVRVSSAMYHLASAVARLRRLQQSRNEFAEGFSQQQQSRNFLRFPMYDYQVDGMLHLAFGGRAILADEQGLGKSVQAIAASKVLHQLWDVQRVLIACPAALKTDWEQQIRKFTDLPCRTVDGPRQRRLELYRDCTEFFVIMSYDQIDRDESEIATILAPDLLILDEAQRIKNWRNKTARAIKRIDTEFAFVLTGTAFENRIDEIYSIVEFIDPHIFGSLFRFNRDFYQLDDRGRPVGLTNLTDLFRRLQPVMLRRKSSDVSGQLPRQIENTYFVELLDRQKRRYNDFEQQLCRVLDKRAEDAAMNDQTQALLDSMRMVCSSATLVDPNVNEAPKLDELLRILSDTWDNNAERKVVVCSEWPQLLEQLRERLDANAIECAVCLCGGERDGALKKFQKSPACRLLLLADADGADVSLDNADMLVNLDLPWDTARLDRRIHAVSGNAAGPVGIVHLIAERTVEHRLLNVRHAGSAEDAQLDLFAGRDRFMERLRQLATPQSPAESADIADSVSATGAVQSFCEALVVSFGDRLRLCRAEVAGAEIETALVVVEGDPDAARHEINRIYVDTHADRAGGRIHVIDAIAYEVLRQLAESNIISMQDSGLRELYRADGFGNPQPTDRDRRHHLAAPLLEAARRKAAMAGLLTDGGFAMEAVAPIREAVDQAAIAMMVMCAATAYTEVPTAFVDSHLPTIQDAGALTVDAVTFLRTYRRSPVADADAAVAFVAAGSDSVRQAAEFGIRL